MQKQRHLQYSEGKRGRILNIYSGENPLTSIANDWRKCGANERIDLPIVLKSGPMALAR